MTTQTENKTWLCREGNEEFTINAGSLKEAQEGAAIYNAVVVREIKPRHTAQEGRRIK